jgi:LysM repeat protein
MKISNATLNILKNFSSINPSLAVKSGNSLKTISPQNNIMAEAIVDESFGKPFAIYELTQFLGACSLFEDPEFDFQEKFVKIHSGNRSIKYFFADATMVKAAGEKKITLPSVDAKFSVTAKQLGEILKAASVLQVPEVAVVTDGSSKTKIVATDTKNSSSNDFSVELDHKSDTKFKLVFKCDNLKMIDGDYDVEVCAKGISRFHNAKQKIEYFVAAESTSQFG